MTFFFYAQHPSGLSSNDKITSSQVSLTECTISVVAQSGVYTLIYKRVYARMYASTYTTSSRERSHESRPSQFSSSPSTGKPLAPSRPVVGVLFTTRSRASMFSLPLPLSLSLNISPSSHTSDHPHQLPRYAGPCGRVSSLCPPAHDIRRPPRDQCTRTFCSKNGSIRSSSSSSNSSSDSSHCCCSRKYVQSRDQLLLPRARTRPRTSSGSRGT